MRKRPLCNLLHVASPPAPQGEGWLCGLASRPAPARTRARLAERGWPRSEEKEKRKELRAAGARCMALSTARELLPQGWGWSCCHSQRNPSTPNKGPQSRVSTGVALSSKIFI